MKNTQILSCASYLPETIVTSDDLFSEIKSEQQYGIAKNWMSDDMGIKERRFSEPHLKPSDLAIPAAEKALQQSNIDRKDIDIVIFCGMERDRPEPATAHTIANNLGINAEHTFDVANACYGFIEGVKIGNQFISCGLANNALIVTSEICSRVVTKVIEILKYGKPVEDAKKYIGFLSAGDAGGAIVLGESLDNKSGFKLFSTRTRSDYEKKCHYNFTKNGDVEGQMKMGQLSALMIKGHRMIFDETLNNLGWEKFDVLLSHQIGKRPFEKLTEIAGNRANKHIKTYDYLGNIASATFPVNFEKMIKDDTLKKGDYIGGMFAGSGLVYGQFGYII